MLEITQRRITGAEIVDRDPDAQASNRTESFYGRVGIFHDRGFGYFQFQTLRIQPPCAQSFDYTIDKIFDSQLPRRDVDRDSQIAKSLLIPPTRLSTGTRQNLMANVDDSAGIFRQMNEFSRRKHSQLPVLPAHQGFHAHQFAGGQIKYRLVIIYE